MLKQIVRLNAGKDVKSMRRFFQSLVNSGQLNAFSCEVDKEETVENGNKVFITKTLGATLTPIRKFDTKEDNCWYFVKDAKTATLYFLTLKHDYSGYVLSDDAEDSQTEYNHCTLERLVADPDLTKVRRYYWTVDDEVPEELIVARLRISYNKDWCKNKVEQVDQGLEIKGSSDNLFKKVCGFVTEDKK